MTTQSDGSFAEPGSEQWPIDTLTYLPGRNELHVRVGVYQPVKARSEVLYLHGFGVSTTWSVVRGLGRAGAARHCLRLSVTCGGTSGPADDIINYDFGDLANIALHVERKRATLHFHC